MGYNMKMGLNSGGKILFELSHILNDLNQTYCKGYAPSTEYLDI